MLKPSDNPSTEPIEPKRTGPVPGEPVSDKIERTMVGEDAPMEEEHPTSPGAIVWFTYPAVLILVLLIGLALMAWWRANAQAIAP